MDISEGNKLKVYPPKLRIKATIAPIINDPKRNPINIHNISTVFQPTSSAVTFCGSSISAVSTKVTTVTIKPIIEIMPTNITKYFIISPLIFYHLFLSQIHNFIKKQEIEILNCVNRQYRNSSLFQSRFRESSLGSSDVDYYNQNIQAPITTIAIDTPVTLLKYMGGNLLNFNFFIVIFFYRGAPLPLILSITLSFQEMFELGIDIEECDIETIQEVIE